MHGVIFIHVVFLGFGIGLTLWSLISDQLV